MQKDRAYLISGSKNEIKLSNKAVEGLIRFNSDILRKNTNVDMLFIKALIIGTCSPLSIENDRKIPKTVYGFIKGENSIKNKDELCD